MGKKYVAYYRVSTTRQGQSGLGLEAQRKMVEQFVRCTDCIIQEFTEIESGKKNDRTSLMRAIAFAKQSNATLVIAKLDRLSRNVAFIATLMESGVNFVCADMPDANSFTIHIFSALAEQERKMISERTKRALAVKKEQGAKLGSPLNLTQAAKEKGAAKRKEKALENDNNKRAAALAKMMRENGKTYEEISQYLNENGFRTSENKNWNRGNVRRVMLRYP